MRKDRYGRIKGWQPSSMRQDCRFCGWNLMNVTDRYGTRHTPEGCARSVVIGAQHALDVHRGAVANLTAAIADGGFPPEIVEKLRAALAVMTGAPDNAPMLGGGT
jgi:hypothetical protein